MGQVTIDEEILRALEEVAEVAQKLCDKLDEVSSHPEYSAVFTSAYVHGVNYNGPTYGEATKAAVASLDALAKAKGS